MNMLSIITRLFSAANLTSGKIRPALLKGKRHALKREASRMETLEGRTLFSVPDPNVLSVQTVPAITASQGQLFNGIVATFNDTLTTNNASDFAATINWGDGTNSAGTVGYVNGAISVTGSHTYLATVAPGTAANVVLNDDAPGTATSTATGTASERRREQPQMTQRSPNVATNSLKS